MSDVRDNLRLLLLIILQLSSGGRWMEAILWQKALSVEFLSVVEFVFGSEVLRGIFDVVPAYTDSRLTLIF